ncbi:MAG: aminotransferase class I/II-fold pyridoxal phosphate-dependent enzyme [Alphaproteobacteria bacterium]|nr:aminotransferase class I/II-fold pyridoxal phosphate-dependent enzyme [Alphaproteobacteria bacterium]
MLNDRLDRLSDYPFRRLAELLGPARPGDLVMSIGEPQHAPPPMVAETLAANASGWGKYPPLDGTPDFRRAVRDWLTRRFGLPEGLVDPDRAVLPVAGTREALYLIAQVACPGAWRPVALLPNPFYQVYWGAAVMAGAEPLLVPAGPEQGFLPDFESIDPAILDRTAIAWACSPANPQGAVASLDWLKRAVTLARRHDFLLCVDECYSEIWFDRSPAGALQACAALGGGLDNVLVFHSLSKRSSVPGLRSGFVAGDERALAAFARLRSYGGASTPLPVIAAAAALWRDETHVEQNRALYRAKMDSAEEILGGRFGFARPQGGFFLWLDVGDGEAAARTIAEKAAIRVLPGAYLARADEDGVNPGRSYIRVALVHDLDTTRDALRRIAAALEG